MRFRRAMPMAAVVVLATLAVVGSASVVSASTAPGIGLTRSQVEQLFHAVDGSHTVFRSATKVKGVPRVLGGDKTLYTVVEVNGSPQVVDVQVVSLLDTKSEKILENQVIYDALTCDAFGGTSARSWCTKRILDPSGKGMVSASGAKDFGGIEITVKTL
ncbi:MAG: hypothetical protein JWM85_519, partial [Acidimicrobiaceae bacterium]|nr:hypothetical protein [Acidimicrobiaceae bacterium]